MSKKYALEIYQPDHNGFVSACTFESETPFLSIQTGDYFNPSTWNFYCFDSIQAENSDSAYGILLKVTGVEHSLVQRENGSIIQHKITVFTKPVENNHAALFGD